MSPADWISPRHEGGQPYRDDPPTADGSKVIVPDTAHPAAPGHDRRRFLGVFTAGGGLKPQSGGVELVRLLESRGWQVTTQPVTKRIRADAAMDIERMDWILSGEMVTVEHRAERPRPARDRQLGRLSGWCGGRSVRLSCGTTLW